MDRLARDILAAEEMRALMRGDIVEALEIQELEDILDDDPDDYQEDIYW